MRAKKHSSKNYINLVNTLLITILGLLSTSFFISAFANNNQVNTQEKHKIQDTSFDDYLDYDIVNDNEVLVKEKNLWEQGHDVLIPKEIIYNNKYYSVKGIADEGFINNVNHINSIVFEKNQNFTYIGENSFKNLNLLVNKEIELPPSIQYIGKNAFANSKNLEKINFESLNKLIKIDDLAFANCSGLTSPIVLGKSIEYIGLGTFQNDKNVDDINLENCERLETINNFCFSGCSKNVFEKLILNDALKKIGEKAFKDTLFKKVLFNFSPSTIEKITFGAEWNPEINEKIFFPYTTIDIFTLKPNFNIANKRELFVDGLPATSITIQSSTEELIYMMPMTIKISTNYGSNPCFKLEVIGIKNADLEIIENIYDKNFTLTLKKWHLEERKISLKAMHISSFGNEYNASISTQKDFALSLFGWETDNIFINTILTLVILNSICLILVIYLVIEQAWLRKTKILLKIKQIKEKIWKKH